MWTWSDKISVGSAIFIRVTGALEICGVNPWQWYWSECHFFACDTTEKMCTCSCIHFENSLVKKSDFSGWHHNFPNLLDFKSSRTSSFRYPHHMWKPVSKIQNCYVLCVWTQKCVAPLFSKSVFFKFFFWNYTFGLLVLNLY